MAESIYRFLMQDALSTGGGQDDALKDKKGDMENEENRRTNKKSLQQQVGIQLTLAAILKQSSIFTGFIGSLFQIVGAFVDTILMSTFPLLKGALKVIMKFFEPIKAISAGIKTVIEVVMKIFSKIGEFAQKLTPDLPGEVTAMDAPGILGNIFASLRGAPGMGKSLLKKIPGIGTGLRVVDVLMGLGAEGDALDKTIGVTQALTSIGVSSAIMTAAGLAAPFTGGGSLLAGAGGVAGYETVLAPMIDQKIESFFYDMAGRAEQDAAYATTPVK